MKIKNPTRDFFLCVVILTMEQEKLIRFISGLATTDEQKEVLDWIGESEENKSTFAQLKNINVAIDIFAEEQAGIKYQKGSFSIKPALVWGAKIAAVLIIALSIFYFGRYNEKEKWLKTSGEQFTEVKVPMGESVSVILPDGSSVKLNSGSVLKFSKLFGEQNRELSLDGEGYFNIQKSDKKFIVVTSDINVEVLGTVFNLSAYNTDRVVTASLYKGSVKIFNRLLKETVILSPKNSYSFDKISQKSIVKNFNKQHGWMDSYFVANGDDIGTFARKIERKYDVKILVDSTLLDKCRYTGVFKGESLEEILRNMAIASPIKYKIQEDKTVIISPTQ